MWQMQQNLMANTMMQSPGGLIQGNLNLVMLNGQQAGAALGAGGTVAGGLLPGGTSQQPGQGQPGQPQQLC